MKSLIICVNAILPIFLLMLIGALARLFGLINEKDVTKMSRVVFVTFLPVMIFNSIYRSDLRSAVQPSLLLYTNAAILAQFLLGVWITKKRVLDQTKRGVIVHALFRTNYSMMGLPIAMALVPDTDYSAVTFLLAAVIPLTNILGVISLETLSGKEIDFKKALMDITKNPLVIASVLGLVFLCLHIQLPTALAQTVNDMAKVPTPFLLFLLGAFFRPADIRVNLRWLKEVSFERLILFPALFLSLAALLGFRGIAFAAMIGLFGSSVATSTFPLAQQMGGDASLAGELVIVTGVLSVFSLFFWCVLSSTLGLI